MTVTPLSPTARTRVIRGEKARADREALSDTLAHGLIAHLGVSFDGTTRVLPTAYGFDLDGPDRDGTLYVHGSVASRSLVQAPGQEVCVTITIVDGLVLARSAFHHSMNFRSAVVLGVPRQLTDAAERDHALRLIVEQVTPGRSEALRANSRKELAATTVLALPLYEASVKTRAGGPDDDEVDIEAGQVWAGHVPTRLTYGEAVDSADLEPGLPVPDHVHALRTGT